MIRDGDDGVHGLEGVFSVAISPDGMFLYTSSGRFGGDSGVSAFKISDDGRLTLLEEHIHGEVDYLDRFLGGNELAVSPDGSVLVVTGTRSSTLVVFDIDRATGRLTYAETIPVNSGATMFDVGTAGLGPAGICFDTTGEFVYIAQEGDKSVAVFKRGASAEMVQ